MFPESNQLIDIRILLASTLFIYLFIHYFFFDGLKLSWHIRAIIHDVQPDQIPIYILIYFYIVSKLLALVSHYKQLPTQYALQRVLLISHLLFPPSPFSFSNQLLLLFSLLLRHSSLLRNCFLKVFERLLKQTRKKNRLFVFSPQNESVFLFCLSFPSVFNDRYQVSIWKVRYLFFIIFFVFYFCCFLKKKKKKSYLPLFFFSKIRDVLFRSSKSLFFYHRI